MASSPQLNSSLLMSVARDVALDVAARRELYLSPDALPAVDTLVEERIPTLNRLVKQGKFEFESWRGHVRTVSERAADKFKAERVKSIDNTDKVLNTVRPILKVYPYD